MPELPEVETVRRVIEPQIRGLSIQNVVVSRPEVIAYPEVFCLHRQNMKWRSTLITSCE